MLRHKLRLILRHKLRLILRHMLRLILRLSLRAAACCCYYYCCCRRRRRRRRWRSWEHVLRARLSAAALFRSSRRALLPTVSSSSLFLILSLSRTQIHTHDKHDHMTNMTLK